MMRAISLVDSLEFDFSGNVLRNALTLGDVDNDGFNELIVGSESGEIAFFKGSERVHLERDVNFVTCLAVGDLMNVGKNCLVVVTGEGWCYVYCYCDGGAAATVTSQLSETSLDDGTVVPAGIDQLDGTQYSMGLMSDSDRSTFTTPNMSAETSRGTDLVPFRRIHTQRIPANSKDILLEDIDGDGKIELVLGLTDRIVRSYRWIRDEDHSLSSNLDTSLGHFAGVSGKLVCLNKWECAKQIGSITLHRYEGMPCLLIAQPGGTFMRIVCTPDTDTIPSSSPIGNPQSSQFECVPGSKVSYKDLCSSHMRNQNISTEIVGGVTSTSSDVGSAAGSENAIEEAVEAMSSCSISANSPQESYVVATLDGTIMLVRDETILWSIAVDRQVFAVSKLDVTNNGLHDIVACCWDGQTYILDQDKNSVRFHFNEAVQAFQSGYYGWEDRNVTCFVYVTFRNKIYVYYDIPLKDIICRRFEPDMTQLKKLLADETAELTRQQRKELVEFLLYGTDYVQTAE